VGVIINIIIINKCRGNGEKVFAEINISHGNRGT
jgi:hypothetical protein